MVAAEPRPRIVQTANGWQYEARGQWPMDADAQRHAGLLASTTRSIHPSPRRPKVAATLGDGRLQRNPRVSN